MQSRPVFSLLSKLFMLWVLAGALSPAAWSAPALIKGVITRVTDGDSLWFSAAGRTPRAVRLRDIDAPEICQTWGAEAHRALSMLALGKPALLRPSGVDRYGRTLGVMRIEGVDIGRRMVQEGHAWSSRGRWDGGPLVKEERTARALGRGLHGAGGAMLPRRFRQAHGACMAG